MGKQRICRIADIINCDAATVGDQNWNGKHLAIERKGCRSDSYICDVMVLADALHPYCVIADLVTHVKGLVQSQDLKVDVASDHRPSQTLVIPADSNFNGQTLGVPECITDLCVCFCACHDVQIRQLLA